MFEHSYADNFVKRVCFSDLPIIANLDLALPCQTCLLDTSLCQFCLWLAQRDPIYLYSVMLCGIDHQSAPATPDIQQSFSWVQAQLATDILEFLFLGCIKIIIRGREICARVDHTRAKPQRIKIVRPVVVIGYSLPVSLFRVPCTAQFCRRISWSRLTCIR